jgi:hypothetical protein
MILKESLTRVPGKGRPKCAGDSQMTRRDKTELATMLGIREGKLGDYTPRFNIATTQPYFVLKTTYESREAIPAIWEL